MSTTSRMTKSEFEARRSLLSVKGKALLLQQEAGATKNHTVAPDPEEANRIFDWLCSVTPTYDPSKDHVIRTPEEIALTAQQVQHVTRLCYCTVDGLMIWIERPDDVTGQPWTLRLANGEEYRDFYLSAAGKWESRCEPMEFEDINQAEELALLLAAEDSGNAEKVVGGWVKSCPTS
jgi:hypothetical protein